MTDRAPGRYPGFAVVMSAAAALCLLWQFRITGDDFFYLSKSGEYFFKTGHVLATNLFSFTAPGSAWVNHSWLTGVIFYAAESLFGLRGPILLLAALAFASALLYVWISGRVTQDPFTTTVLTLSYLLLCFYPAAVLRPWVLSNLFYLAFISVIAYASVDSERVRRSRPLLIGLELLILLAWVQCHGSYYLGYVLFVLSLWALATPWRWGVISALAAASLFFINPFGVPYANIPLTFMHAAWNAGGHFLDFLYEWQSPLRLRDRLDYWIVSCVVILGLLVLRRWRRGATDRFTWIHTVVFLLTGGLALSARRHYFLFWSGNTVLWAGEIRSLLAPLSRGRVCATFHVNDRRANVAVVLATALLMPVLLACRNDGGLIDPAYWPARLIEFFQGHPEYRGMNGFWDFYLSNIPIRRSDLGIKVFYDLREYCYPEDVTRDFLTLYYSRDDESTLSVIRKWDLRYFVIRRSARPGLSGPPLLLETMKPHLDKVYEDEYAQVYRYVS